jgi:hypothetical protein
MVIEAKNERSNHGGACRGGSKAAFTAGLARTPTHLQRPFGRRRQHAADGAEHARQQALLLLQLGSARRGGGPLGGARLPLAWGRRRRCHCRNATLLRLLRWQWLLLLLRWLRLLLLVLWILLLHILLHNLLLLRLPCYCCAC